MYGVRACCRRPNPVGQGFEGVDPCSGGCLFPGLIPIRAFLLNRWRFAVVRLLRYKLKRAQSPLYVIKCCPVPDLLGRDVQNPIPQDCRLALLLHVREPPRSRYMPPAAPDTAVHFHCQLVNRPCVVEAPPAFRVELIFGYGLGEPRRAADADYGIDGRGLGFGFRRPWYTKLARRATRDKLDVAYRLADLLYPLALIIGVPLGRALH